MQLTFGPSLGLDLSSANGNYSNGNSKADYDWVFSFSLCIFIQNIFELVSGLVLYMRILVVDISQRNIGISSNLKYSSSPSLATVKELLHISHSSFQ